MKPPVAPVVAGIPLRESATKKPERGRKKIHQAVAAWCTQWLDALRGPVGAATQTGSEGIGSLNRNVQDLWCAGSDAGTRRDHESQPRKHVARDKTKTNLAAMAASAAAPPVPAGSMSSESQVAHESLPHSTLCGIAHRIAQYLDGVRQQVSLRIHAEQLGDLEITIRVKDSQIHLRFATQNEDAMIQLRQSLNDLRHILGQTGIALGSFAVDVRPSQAQRRRSSKEEFRPVDETSEENRKTQTSSQQALEPSPRALNVII